MTELSAIKNKVSEIILDILQAEGNVVELTDETPFFGTEEHPGIIQDSLAILEISSKLADEYSLFPSDFNEEAFLNVQTLSELILSKVDENTLAVV
jgi:acyl carrier protein